MCTDYLTCWPGLNRVNETDLSHILPEQAGFSCSDFVLRCFKHPSKYASRQFGYFHVCEWRYCILDFSWYRDEPITFLHVIPYIFNLCPSSWVRCQEVWPFFSQALDFIYSEARCWCGCCGEKCLKDTQSNFWHPTTSIKCALSNTTVQQPSLPEFTRTWSSMKKMQCLCCDACESQQWWYFSLCFEYSWHCTQTYFKDCEHFLRQMHCRSDLFSFDAPWLAGIVLGIQGGIAGIYSEYSSLRLILRPYLTPEHPWPKCGTAIQPWHVDKKWEPLFHPQFACVECIYMPFVSICMHTISLYL